jgi:hypothetical protein
MIDDEPQVDHHLALHLALHLAERKRDARKCGRHAHPEYDRRPGEY